MTSTSTTISTVIVEQIVNAALNHHLHLSRAMTFSNDIKSTTISQAIEEQIVNAALNHHLRLSSAMTFSNDINIHRNFASHWGTDRQHCS